MLKPDFVVRRILQLVKSDELIHFILPGSKSEEERSGESIVPLSLLRLWEIVV